MILFPGDSVLAPFPALLKANRALALVATEPGMM